MTMLPLKMFKKVCRFRMFSVSHPPIWPPVTCRGSCSPSVGLSPHPDELAGGCDWTKRHPPAPGPAAASRSSMPEIPSLNPDSPSPSESLDVDAHRISPRKESHQPGRFAKDQGSVSACVKSRTPSGSFRSRSRDNLCS